MTSLPYHKASFRTTRKIYFASCYTLLLASTFTNPTHTHMKLLLLLSLCLSTLGFANNFESNFASQTSKFLDALDPEQHSEMSPTHR